MKIQFGLVLCIPLLTLVGCGSSDLSRGSAEEFIEASEYVQSETGSIIGIPGFAVAGEQQGLWTSEKGTLLLTPRASREIWGIRGSQIIPTGNFSIDVEVTGIVEDPRSTSLKNAEFTWKYENLAPLVRRFTIDGGSGVAIFQKYDDGWRLSSVNIKREDKPAELSPSEQAAVESDIAAEAARKAVETKAMYALWSEGKARKTLYFNYPGTVEWYRTDFTDNAMISYNSKSRRGPWQRDGSYWYGVMTKPRNHSYASGSLPGTISMLLWRPGGSVNYATRTYGTMGISVDQFLEILNTQRDNWRQSHAEILDGDIVKAKYSEVYNALHTVEGLKKTETE